MHGRRSRQTLRILWKSGMNRCWRDQVVERGIAWRKRFHSVRPAVHGALMEASAFERLMEAVDYIDSDVFHQSDAEAVICGPAPEVDNSTIGRVPTGLPAYLIELYRVPLLTKVHEQYYFRRMNFRKFQFSELRKATGTQKPSAHMVSKLESHLADITEVKNLLIRFQPEARGFNCETLSQS